ncbi:MAG: UDP-N-acetylmuramoyl-L-alanyl-D-glutamate--2,6-diaminopimelate ligase [Acidobacteria bacterium]|nr:MAG: UDP-N-acetylmuramoyl-L-alanyl-D-glutamate--2,6-diaminopimelate ligase [Acidobacteriota bacterium]
MTWRDAHDVLASRNLVRQAPGARPDAATPVTGIAYDSRRACPGEIFVALKGQHADGTAFAVSAVERGVVGVVSEDASPPGFATPWISVESARLALAFLSAAFYGNPSTRLRVVGITGTNGKTTTAHLVASILEAATIRCGVIGTVAYRIGDVVRDATKTTPEAPELQSMLRAMVDAGCGACAMEVSSHALALRRVDGTTFAAGVFTNLTREHLDFHADMADYFRAKRRLFELLAPEASSVINIDDPRGPTLVDTVPHPLTYAINRAADVTPGPLSFSFDGLKLDVRTPRGVVHVASPLVGRPNVYNILAAVSTGVALNLTLSTIEKGIAALSGVPGRFQIVSRPGDEVTVIVDYAHTDDALRNLIETARPLTQGRLVTVFGCGGDRDRTKRPLMGAIASRLSDVVLITSDNPRSEDPQRIIEDIQRGLVPETRRPPGAPGILAIPDRGEAIRKAIDLARPGDLVLIAGKGHEKYQVIGDRAFPFDDVAVAREALDHRRGSRSAG